MAGLESASFIDELNSANPAGTDGRTTADDHLRLIKAVLKASFPDVDQAVSTIIPAATEPTLAQAGTIWFDTTNNLLKLRNEGDTAWVTLALDVATSNTVDIDGGTIDGVSIGAATPVTAITVDNINIDGNTLISTDTNGNIELNPNGAGIVNVTGNTTVTGNISVTGTVDGRDVATDGAKLDGIEALADVTDATNVDAAGAVMEADYGTSTLRFKNSSSVMGNASVTASQIVGRTAASEIKGMTAAETKTVLGLGTLADLSSVTQTELGSSAVGQAQLKTTTGQTSTTSNNSLTTGPGGEYGFWPTLKHSSGGAVRNMVLPASTHDAAMADITVTLGTSFANRIHLGTGAGTLTVQQRYIQASPPYFLGSIEVPTFIFAMVENVSGNILAMYQAADPPWANNGPTNIRPDRIDLETGRKYKTIRTRRPLSDLNAPDFWIDTEVEITSDFKNSDMGVIPHPFIDNELTGMTIVMVDPRMKLVRRLHEMGEAGELTLPLFHDNNIRLGNTDIPAVTRPSGVMVVSATLI